MVTTTPNVNAFDKSLYEALAAAATKYAREGAIGQMVGRIPAATGIQFNANQFKKPIYGESTGVSGGKPSLDKEKMLTSKSHNVYNLKNVNAMIYWDQEDMMEQGAYLVQQKAEQMAEWARIANISLFKGVYTKGYSAPATAATGSAGQGSQLTNGILDQATSVTNLDGTNSVLTTAGDVYAALVKMVTSIPFRYVSGKKITLGMTPHFYDMANSSTYTNDSGVTEWDQFFKLHMTGQSPYQIDPQIIYSDDLFKTSTDITNTNDRLFACITENNILERAYSRGFALMGEARNSIGGIDQTWTTKLKGCVHDANAVLYSEQIAWV